MPKIVLKIAFLGITVDYYSLLFIIERMNECSTNSEEVVLKYQVAPTLEHENYSVP